MKRYLIEAESVTSPASDSESTTNKEASAPNHKVVYRIVDTATRQTIPPESEDIGVVAGVCIELNAADGKAQLEVSVGDQLPEDIVQSIAISNAKAIHDQPAILANLALAQQIFNQNMRQQIALSHQQAMNQIKLAVVAKCVALISDANGHDRATVERVEEDIEKLVRKMERLLDGSTSTGSSQQAS